MFKPQKFPVVLFIAASITALILFPVILMIFKSLVFPEKKVQNNFYYDASDDPFMTKPPTLRDLLDGPITDGNDPLLGSRSASVAIVYFSDFTCEFCKNQEEIIKKAINEYKDKIKLVWKDYPENNPDSLSYKASIAARCADSQNKFWQYHDRLFSKSNALTEQTFAEIADELKLDKLSFKRCLENQETKLFIENNAAEADALRIYGVPFIFVNKQEVMGEINYEELKNMIEMELNKI